LLVDPRQHLLAITSIGHEKSVDTKEVHCGRYRRIAPSDRRCPDRIARRRIEASLRRPLAADCGARTVLQNTLSDIAAGGYLTVEMQSKSDAQLLREYAEHGAETAFSEIVTRHTNLVYSAALRQVDSPDVAAEVAQSVFIGLARGARSLSRTVAGNASLAGWLCRTARNISLNLRRDEFRRHSRARQAMENLDSTPDTAPEWERLRSVLDEAMSGLSEPDYDALVLRFYKNQDLRSVGLALGVSDDTAQKRVSRALDKLHGLLSQRGITTSVAALATVLSANAVQVAPAGLAITISTTAALTATTLATTATATKAIVMTTLQKTMFAAALTAAVGTGVYEARQVSRLRSENQSLIAQQEKLTDERDKALAVAAGKDNELERSQKDKSDLLRLRGEVGWLRRQTNELAGLREANRQLQASVARANQAAPRPEAEPEPSPEIKAVHAKLNDAKLLVLGLLMYASDNRDRYPDDLMQTTNYLAKGEHRLTGTNQFELVVQGSLKNVAHPGTTIVVREKEASLVKGTWVKAYGFADGHSEYKKEPPEGFDAWEKQHIIPPTNP